MGFLREKWTEDEVLNLPQGEHNYFDRKSGRLFADRAKLYGALAKALSALANSAGGHLILGQDDDGTIDGVPEKEGRTPIREWLEQKVPALLSYPLEAFRVHAVQKHAAGTRVPDGRELVVIDVGESRLAPHQACFPPDNPQYYYRQGGKSMPAPHHYLEALRNRLTAAVLEARLDSVTVEHRYFEENAAANADSGFPFVAELCLHFKVTNVSRVACYKWDVVASMPTDDEQKRLIVTKETFPKLGSAMSGISIDDTILPTLTARKTVFMGLRVFGMEVTPQRDIPQRIMPLEVHYYTISENHIGERRVTKLSEVITASKLWQLVLKSLSSSTGR
jgi:hypothetical protein